MKNLPLIFLFIVCSFNAIVAQIASDSILFTVDDVPVYVNEFKRVYNKNLDLVKDESQKDVDTYLELFVNYKLKLKEARALGLHEAPKYKREFTNYRKQLAKNYLTDTDVTETLIKQAYDRTTHEIRASHILVMAPENASAQDTLKAYNKLLDAKKEISEGEDFAVVAKKYSEDPSAAQNGGDLGYFGGFKMVYDFENAAFNTNQGDVSEPFRTRFGYHIVTVTDKRKSLGELTVAHIMVSSKKTKDSLQEQPENRINDIYKKLLQGEKFESLAKQFSEDKASAKKGGKLNKFGKGQLSSKEFEEAAFSLAEIDDISTPIKTNFGWHIIKLIDKHPVSSYEDMKAELESKIRRGSRSNLITKAFTDKLKKKYDLKPNQEALDYFTSILNDDFYKRSWKIPETLDKEKTLVTIGNSSVKYSKFANYLASSQRKINSKKPFKNIVQEGYEAFLSNQVLSYYENNLESENNEFKVVVEEYRDGLLLFDLMQSQVWNATKDDSLGLQKYFDKNAPNYNWKKRAVATVASSSKKSVIKKVAKYFKKGWSSDKIKQTINKKGKLHVIFTADTMDAEHQALPKTFSFKKGISPRYKHNNSYVVVNTKTILESTPKTFEETKGKVINDYQAFIEQEWLQNLREKYKVAINAKVLDRVKKEINN